MKSLIIFALCGTLMAENSDDRLTTKCNEFENLVNAERARYGIHQALKCNPHLRYLAQKKWRDALKADNAGINLNSASCNLHSWHYGFENLTPCCYPSVSFETSNRFLNLFQIMFF